MNSRKGAIIVSRVIAAAALLASAPGHAGKIVTESDKDGRKNIETLEFNEKGQARVTSNGLDSLGMIARDKRLYFFGELKGKPKVVDMLAALKKLQDKGMKRPESDPAVEEIADIKPTGRKETIAGIEGEAHVVTWALAGKKRTEEIVLTRDPRLAGVIKGLSLDPGLMSRKPRKAELKEQVHALGAFLLKSQNSVVTSADFSPTPDARFALKAKPGDDVDTIMEIVMSAAFGAMGAAAGGPDGSKPKAAKEAGGKPPSKVNVSSDDIKACDLKKMPMTQCRAMLVRKYGKPTEEDASSFAWEKFRGADAPGTCYSFSVQYGGKEVSGYSFATDSCE